MFDGVVLSGEVLLLGEADPVDLLLNSLQSLQGALLPLNITKAV